MDDNARAVALLAAVLTAPLSRSFCGYWQNHGPRGGDRYADDFFANFVRAVPTPSSNPTHANLKRRPGYLPTTPRPVLDLPR